MPYLRLTYLIFILIFCSNMAVSSIKVAPYDINSAIRTSIDDDNVIRSNVIATSENNKLNVYFLIISYNRVVDKELIITVLR